MITSFSNKKIFSQMTPTHTFDTPFCWHFFASKFSIFTRIPMTIKEVINLSTLFFFSLFLWNGISFTWGPGCWHLYPIQLSSNLRLAKLFTSWLVWFGRDTAWRLHDRDEGKEMSSLKIWTPISWELEWCVWGLGVPLSIPLLQDGSYSNV